MASEDTEGRILTYLARRAARPEHLEQALGPTSAELSGRHLAEMETKGWLTTGIAAWYGEPSSAITIVSLTPAGRDEAQRREAKLGELEPIVITRDELLAKLRELGHTEEDIARQAELGHSHYNFWPSISAWQGRPE